MALRVAYGHRNCRCSTCFLSLPTSRLHLPAPRSCADSEELLLLPGKFCNLHQFYVYTCGSTVMSKVTSGAPFPSFCRPQDISVLQNVTESLKVFSIYEPFDVDRWHYLGPPISITGSLLLVNSYYVSVVSQVPPPKSQVKSQVAGPSS